MEGAALSMNVVVKKWKWGRSVYCRVYPSCSNEPPDAVKNHVNKFVQVSELYHDSNNTYKKDKSYKNCGMARVSILDEEGQKE
eukprot:scaffold4849_cov153-Amphora_coffeaeformis.AAC.6